MAISSPKVGSKKNRVKIPSQNSYHDYEGKNRPDGKLNHYPPRELGNDNGKIPTMNQDSSVSTIQKISDFPSIIILFFEGCKSLFSRSQNKQSCM